MKSKLTKWRQCQMVLLLSLVLYTTSYQKAMSQAPNLPEKDSLAQTLFTNQNFLSATQVDTLTLPLQLGDSYTLEVVTKVNQALGRGMDIEGRNSIAKGFRVSLDEQTLNWTSSLSSSIEMASTSSDEYYTVRVAVENEMAHVYQNGVYLQTFPVSTIYDISNGEESNELPGGLLGSSLITDWAGTSSDNSGRPSDYGWGLEGTTVDMFNTANSGSGVRYLDYDENTSPLTYNGEVYAGRIMFIRWDNNSLNDAVYTYPVTLAANTVYNFSMLHAFWANATGSRNINVGIGKTTDPNDAIASNVFYSSGTRNLKSDNFSFTSEEAGTYYLTFTGAWALYAISELSVNEINIEPRLIFGKNYPDGNVDMKIASASFENGAYAPATITTGMKQDVIVTGKEVYYPTTFNTNFVVSGKTDLHLTGEYTPLVNSSVSLNSADAWLFFDNISPAEVIEDWLDKVTINGMSAINNPNVRMSIYKNGTAIIPNGNQTSTQALEVFTNTGLSGMSNTYEIDTFHTDLGAFDNNIGSFKLQRGYMATFASNSDGSGFSRVYIANDEDLEVTELPKGLNGAVSFIRVFKWDWVSKKGKAGWSPAKLNCTWYYDWNIGGNSSDDYQYATIRQNAGWPSWDAINNKERVNHLLGFNEPDRPDQADMTVEEAIEIWPEMMNSGMRIGSPAPADPFNNWLPTFLDRCEELNYRVDFAAIHCYWGGLTPEQWYSRLKQLHERFKRPLWITEWNNGANWTSEYWPDAQDAQFQKQLNDMRGILNVLDTASFVERYAIYDWVEDKRAMVLADTLTPAGEYYAANKSDFAFDPAKEFIHTWALVAPTLTSTINENDYFKVTLNWGDVNGEMGSKYKLERKIDGLDADFVVVQELTDYVPGEEVAFGDSVYDKASYRVQAVGIGGETAYSNTVEVIRDTNPAAPMLQAEVLSSSIIKLTWDEIDEARSFNLKRSLDKNGSFETVLARTTEFAYLDEELISDTTYFYTISSLNSAGESENGDTIAVKTLKLVAPKGVLNPRVASADSRITLSWDFRYDAMYKILKSETEGGPYDTLIAVLDTTNYIDSAVVNGQTYYYKLLAYNELGESPLSKTLEGKPVVGQHLFVSFDEASGTFAEDSWGGNHATLIGDADRVGGYVYAGALNLTGENDAHALLPEGVVNTLDDFTIATWVKLTSLSTWMRIFDFGIGTSSYMFLTPQAGRSNGMSTVRYGIKNGGEEYTVSYLDTLPLNTWTHFAVTQSEDTVRLYLNGELVTTSTEFLLSPSDLGITTDNFIGKSQWSDPLLNGAIDEFKIYNYALSEAEIAEVAAPAELSVPVEIKGFTTYSADSKITLDWDLAYDVVYDIYRAESEEGEFEKIVSGLDALNYVDTDVDNTTTYFYKLVAYNEAGQSPMSDALQATPVEGRHAYFDFEEDNGTLVKDKWSAYQGHLRNDASWKAGRMYLTNAIALDNSKESYIELEEGIVSTLNDFTISSWVKVNELNRWMRIFDFGSGTSSYMFLTPQASSSNGMSTVRYGIKNGGEEYSVSYLDTLPLNTWTHFAVTQSEDTVRLYLNGEVVAVNTEIPLTPADLGITPQNYIGKSQWPDPFLHGVLDDFKIYNYALSETELLEELKSPQVITFEAISAMHAGDSDFTLSAASSAELKVAYSSSDSSVAIVDTLGVVRIMGVGVTEIAAEQGGNEEYLPAKSVQSFTVNSIAMEALYMDADNSENNNTIKPYIQLVNNDEVSVDLQEITVRYWVTMEKFSGARVDIHYAELGNQVNAAYVELEEPRDNALGYVEYSFDSGTGVLDPINGTGVIQSMIANTDWKQLDESNDYSYQTGASSYQLNDHITVYRKGQLIWGTEPAMTAPQQLIKVKSLSINGGSNTMSTYVEIENQGNTALQYDDLSMRYWFTSEGKEQLNYWIDYSYLNKNGIDAQFVKLDSVTQNADTYFEISMDSTLGIFYPLSSSGPIQYRIAKSNWTAFDETNDHSYNASSSYVSNNKITVYYKGDLIYGVEPFDVAENAASRIGLEKEVDSKVFSIYPNPVVDNLTINLEAEALVTIINLSGNIVWQRTISQSTNSIDLSSLNEGLYIIKVQSENMHAVKKILKE
ncbi:LamG-like jellyroll fold domain-containing protein [Flammeovirgaceae bacterium SG7u.111]|nr:LamG-like jellyroll fold domain-containing protein [Flammeovirgaceae bacterium SG7u.132]WPO33378.1 LamG-like jellyroll fold domain-containing protein [Flammeovirgaceae bacterium SG7u.111]